MIKKCIAVDFDGVIHKYSEKWKDGTIYDGPISGVKEALEKLSKNYKILIFSTRNFDRIGEDGKDQKNQIKEMEQWLNKYNIPYDEIYTGTGKPIAKLYIDDNAYRFEGSWSTAVQDIEKILEE
jgi:hypothetical protein